MSDRDHLAEYVAEVRDECRDDVLAADIAEALVRNAGMAYLDMTSPEEAAHIAARVARERLPSFTTIEGVPSAIVVRDVDDDDRECFVESVIRHFVALAEATPGLPPETPVESVVPLIIFGDVDLLDGEDAMRAAGWVRLAGVRAEVEFIRSLGEDTGDERIVELGWPEVTAAFDRLWEGTSRAEATAVAPPKIVKFMRSWIAEHGEAPTGQAWSMRGFDPTTGLIGDPELVNLPGFPSTGTP